MPETKTFQIGDTVTWTSQAGGKSKTKTGKVVAAVPAGKSGREYLPLGVGLSATRIPSFNSRDHESYLIQVGKSKRLYWPLVKYLEKVSEHQEFEPLAITEREDGTLKWIPAAEPSPLERYKRETDPHNCDPKD